ncbi:Molybdenum cofactor sulfurase [Chionoecetes opilio]|uniref:Molybdenum cofactor sulfurase n=1 Tax=Chionoecetes opilio TaxID=41210 RepID=A0A8J4YJU7_CHIOP|nr:Molybdenum cofactor sulfurase [Chionoecetes opilio]
MDAATILSSLKVPACYDVEEVVEKEFHRTKGHHYLDHAGAALYSEGQVHRVMGDLSSALLGNPHSRHGPSDASTQTIEATRHRILEHFNTTAEDYDLIFTSGATAALRLIAETFAWSPGHRTPPEDSEGGTTEPENLTAPRNSEGETTELRDKTQQCKQTTKEVEESQAGAFVYLQENHTSVLGMRGPAHEAGCDVYCLTTAEARHHLTEDSKGLSITKNPVLVTSCESTAVTTVENHGFGIQGSMNGYEDLTRACQDPMAPKESSISPSTPSGSSSHAPQDKIETQTQRRNCLFAYSAQCNFSGSKAPLEWIKMVQDRALDDLLLTPPMNKKETERSRSTGQALPPTGCSRGTTWYVVLDAASLVATCPLDLSRWKPDFVPVSFYKMFGYPTGLGCLLVARRAWGVLGRTYQGGGTVLMMDSRQMVTVPRPTLHERFEDGTLAFLSIPAVRHGLDTINRLTGGTHNVASHVHHLARYTHHTLRSMRHARGTPVARLYLAPGDSWHPTTHGPIVNFNLRNADGSFVGYAQVERVASLYNLHLRTGCLCNPGACQLYLGITPDKLQTQFKAGHMCGDALDLVDGEPTGSVRVSFGYSSTYQDADQLLRMVRECFVEEPLTFDLTWMKEEIDLSWLRPEGKREIGVTGDEKTERVEMKGVDKIEEEREADVIAERGKKGDINDGKKESSDNNNIYEAQNYKNDEAQDYRNAAVLSVTTPQTYLSNDHLITSDSTSNHHLITDRTSNDHLITSDSPSNQPNQIIASDSTSQSNPSNPLSTHRLTDIVVYPVKSCAGVRMGAWRLGGGGLWLDRRWMVVTAAGATITQKRLPRMALITPRIDLELGEMVLSYEGEAEWLHIPLDPTEPLDTSAAAPCGGRVCGVRVKGLDCGEGAGDWLSRVLEVQDLRLMMQTNLRSGKLGRGAAGTPGESLSLANESQYLVIHRPSVRSLLREMNSRGLEEELTEDELVERFRGNLVVDGGEAYEEDSWDALTINGATLKAGCRRCQMVCVVPGSGQRTKEPMLSLASARGPSMLFGVHASALPTTQQGERRLCVGSVTVTMK